MYSMWWYGINNHSNGEHRCIALFFSIASVLLLNERTIFFS
jgi:hypothetical protein